MTILYCDNCGRLIRDEFYFELRFGKVDDAGDIDTDWNAFYHQKCLGVVEGNPNTIYVMEEILQTFINALSDSDIESTVMKNLLNDILKRKNMIVDVYNEEEKQED